jgi:hypothetical protein
MADTREIGKVTWIWRNPHIIRVAKARKQMCSKYLVVREI